MSDLASAGPPAPAQSAPGNIWKRLLARPEMAIVVAVLLLLTILVSATKVMHVTTFQGDTALYFQLTKNIADRGEPISAAYTEIIAFQKGKSYLETPQQIAVDPLLPPAHAEGNVIFTLHSYYIMYPIALLAKIFPISPLLMTLFAITFVGMLGLVYFALRRERIPAIAALLFCVIVMSHPAWSQALMDGQFYPDRLFMLLGLIFFYLCGRDDIPRGALIAAAILASLVIERAPLTIGMFTLAYVVLYWKRPGLDRYFKLGIGIAFLLAGVFILKFGLANPAYSSFLPTSISGILAEFANPAFAQKAILFGIINGVLLIVAFFEWRAALIAAFIMLPNVLGNIGGAEKIGWSTHYHSFYFPVLVWAAMLGYAAAYRRFSAMRRRRFFYAGGVLVAIALSAIDPFAFAPMNVSLGNVAKNFVFTFPGAVTTYLGPTGQAAYAAGVALNRAIPDSATVTTPEGGMPYLYDKREMYFYPIGIDSADYAVVGYTAVPGKSEPIYSGALTFYSDERTQFNAVLTERMRRDGYDLAHPTLFPQFGLAVVRRYNKGEAHVVPVATTAVASVAPTPAPTSTPAKPLADAVIVQHASTIAAQGIAQPTDLTGKFPHAPVPGHILLAFASTGFGSKPAPGWTLVGTDPTTFATVASHVVQSGDGATFVPFTTTAANGYTLVLIEVAGGPDIVGSDQVGGAYVLATRVTNRASLAVPQQGGVLFQFYAGHSKGTGPRDNATLPAGQKQILIENVPQTGNAAGLIVRATTTDPFAAKQPFAVTQTMLFSSAEAPGNIVSGWLVWVGGRTAKSAP